MTQAQPMGDLSSDFSMEIGGTIFNPQDRLGTMWLWAAADQVPCHVGHMW